MKQRDSLPKKSHSAAPLIYGRYFSIVRGKAERDMEKNLDSMKLRAQRKEKLLVLIQLFKEFFENSQDIVELAEKELFKQWEKHRFF